MIGISLDAALDRKREVNTAGLFIIAKDRFGFILGSAVDLFSLDLYRNVVIGIEKIIFHGAVTECDLEFIYIRTLIVFFADVLDLVPLCRVINQRPIEIRIFDNLF